MQITALITSFKEKLELDGRSAATVKTYSEAVKRLLKFTAASKKVSVGSLLLSPSGLTVDLVNHYKRDMAKRGRMPSYIATEMYLLAGFVRYLIKGGYLPKKAIDIKKGILDLAPSKTGEILPVVLKQWQIDGIIEQCEGVIEKSFITLLYHTGCRISELLNLDDQPDITAGAAVPDGEKYEIKVRGKGNKERIIPLNQKAVEAIVSLRQFYKLVSDGHVISYKKKNARKGKLVNMSYSSAYRLVKRVVAKANCPDAHPHTFRHSFATNLLNSGGEITVIASLMGHKDLNTTKKYIQVSDKRKEAAVAMLE